MQKHAKIKRFAALVLALVMALSSLTITPVAARENTEVSVDIGLPPAETTSPPAINVDMPEEIIAPEESEPEAKPEDDDLVEPMFVGIPPAPTLSHAGGVYQSAFNLSIHGHGADVRFTTDGSEPRTCGPIVNGRSTYGPSHVFPHVTNPTCGCSLLLRPTSNIRVNHGHGTGEAASHSNSPMSVGGVGRANPAPWNVDFSQNADDEDSSYVSPNRVGGNGASGRGTAASPPTVPAARVPAPIVDGSPVTGGPAPHTVSSTGYYVPTQIYNGMVVRARAFDVSGAGGRTTTGTYIVNRPDMNWDGVRILSIVTEPSDFVHPVRGWYRNWDRGMTTWNNRNTENPNHWINVNYYNWESQIRAGMWDGKDHENNPVPPLAPGLPTHPGNNNGQGWGLTVPRHTGNPATCGCGSSASSCRAGHLMTVWDHADGSRQIVNVEVFDEENRQVVNQLGNAWIFGNWTRFFPLRSIRINFNQGDGDVISIPGGPSLIPDTRRHYYAANEELTVFRHLNVRNGDTEGTDLRDVLSHRMSHPLRPTVQNATFGAVFINGEFWGMHNLQAHRHEALISEIFGVERNEVELIADGEWINYITEHIVWPASRPSGAPSSDPDGNIWRGVRTDNVTEVGGTRRKSAGNATAATIGDHGGYARIIPERHPITNAVNAHAGKNHLTHEWYEYLDTIIDMDDLIDMFIIGMHFENWDWISNNFEAWRTRSYMPGVYGADRRWRFIMQDFDNAVFHGANDMLTYYTAFKSPTCVSSCRHGENTECWNNREGRTGTGGGFVDMGLPFNLFDLGRSENAARLFRVLLENPTFRNTFAARYSTYTGTAFHPARVENVVDEYATFASLGGATAPAIGRHHMRWGLLITASEQGRGNPSVFARVFGEPAVTVYNNTRMRHGPFLTPWETESGNSTMAQRANAWLNGGEPYRWPPHSLRGTNTDSVGGVPLRNQEDVLRLRAAPATAPGGLERNSIEHMRAYFARPEPSGAISGAGAFGREHMPGPNAGLGGVGAYARVNWRISTGGAGTNNDVGWYDIAGAQIRKDLYEWGNLADYNREVLGYPGFSIGNFSARYVRNMPITVTINDVPGNEFTSWTISPATALTSGTTTSRTITITPTAETTVTANFNTSPERKAIINQVFGQGAAGGNTAISHGFIELYNPWDEPVNLNGTSLQIQNIGNNAPSNMTATQWNVFPLSGTILPRRSFLIVSKGSSDAWYNDGSTGGHIPNYIITKYDMAVPVQFSNRNISVALVDGNTALSPVITNAEQNRIQDLVGARNANAPRDQVHNVWGPQAAWRISLSSSTRRKNFQNTRDNWADFEEVRYSDLTFAEINHYRPRSTEDGEWPVDQGNLYNVTVDGGVMGYRAFPNPAGQGDIVSLTAGMSPPGMAFDRWTSDDVTVLEPTSATGAYFVMPNKAVMVTANFVPIINVLPESTIIVNQLHGQGLSRGDNAISHGFIELYNPSPNTVSLNGKSIQIMNDANGDWHKLDIPAGHEMKPGASFLIVSTERANTNNNPALGHVPRYIIPDEQWDIGWNILFGHNSLTVAIVNNTNLLSHPISAAEWENVLDLVTAVNSPPPDPLPDFLGEGPAFRMWRQGAARRKDYQNTQDNQADFVGIDYRYPTGYAGARPGPASHANGITDERLEQIRPRWSYDGASGVGVGHIEIRDGGRIGAGALPNPATPGQRVDISAGYNDGFVFTHWTVEQGGVALDNPNSRITFFTMPSGLNEGVILRAHWDERYNVKVNESRASIEESGQGIYNEGERVVLFAGYRIDGHFFNGWSGHNVHLLNDRNAPIAYFYMPDRDVEFHANWVRLEGSNPFPMNLVAVANEPGLTHAVWAPGVHINEANVSVPGVGYSELIGHANSTLHVTGPGMHTLILATSRDSGVRTDLASRRFVHVTVAEDGTVTSPSTFRNISWDNQPRLPHGRISSREGSDDVFVSYRAGDPQTTTNPAAGIPAGHTPRSIVDLYRVTVVGSHAAVPSTDGSLTGQARFPEGRRVAINAGELAGQVFTGWTVDPPDAVTFADRTDPITSFIMPAQEVTVTASFGDMSGLLPSQSIIINQVYGQGTGSNNAVSHPFIELYNPTSIDVDIGDWSLQVWNQDENRWNVLALPHVTMEPGTSFLVVSTAGSASSPRYTIPMWDWTWNQPLSGRSLSVALVSRTTPLSSIFSIQDWRHTVDLVGVAHGTDTVHHTLGGSPAQSTSNNNATRRMNFANTRRNSADFEAINYSTGGINDARLQVVRPRFSGDGDWASDLVSPGQTAIIGGGAGANATPANATGNQEVTINAGTNAGLQFSHWVVMAGGVELADSTSSTTTFRMPLTPVAVTVQANWKSVSGVSILNGGTGHSGQGSQPVGERVVIFAGTGAPGFFFDAWTGADVSLLDNPNAPITFFTMPERPVSFTATWERKFQPPTWPMVINVVQNPTAAPGIQIPGNPAGSNFPAGTSGGPGGTMTSAPLTHAAFMGVGHTTSDQVHGLLQTMPRTISIPSAGDYTIILNDREASNISGGSAGRFLHITVDAEGNVTVPWAGNRCAWGQWRPSIGATSWPGMPEGRANYAVVSHNVAGENFLSYGTGLPAGTTEGSAPATMATYAVTVNGAYDGATALTGALTGSGVFPAEQLVAINAGHRTGQIFNGWNVTPATVTLANPSSAITTFTMPSSPVTVTATWTADTRTNPTVNWPTNLTAQFGQTLGSLLPIANTGGTPGTFEWVDGADVPVGNVGTRTHNLRFVPTNQTQFLSVTRVVNVVVSGAPAPTLTFPTASNLVLGQPLSTATLNGGVSAPAVGTWSWVNGDTIPSTVGQHTHQVAFTPTGAHITSFNWTGVPGYTAGPPLRIIRNVTVNVVLPPQRPPIYQDVLINQVYGHGATPNDNAISHGFIELVNMTNAPISLNGYSLQVQNIGLNVPANIEPVPWQVLNLNGRTIPANRSLLIVSQGASVNNSSVAGHTPRYTIPEWDIAWDLPFNDQNISVALVQGTEPLTSPAPISQNVSAIPENEIFERVVDMLGTQGRIGPNDWAHNFLNTANIGYSRYQASRRINLQDTRHNQNDFAAVDYRFPTGYAGAPPNAPTSNNGITNEQLQQFRPRHSDEERWGAGTGYTVTATGTAAANTVITPSGSRPAGTTMTVTVNAPAGQRFAGLPGSNIPVTGAASFNLVIASSRLSATGTFPMPQGGGTITVNVPFETDTFVPGVVINQMYGRAMTNNQAVSRGFIEIYNPLDTPFDLAGHSLQVQNIADGPDGINNEIFPWQVLNFSTALTDTVMPPRTSLLVVTREANATGARHVITEFDAEMDMVFSNRNFSAAIVTDTTRLSNTITAAESEKIMDLVGVVNGLNNNRDMIVNFRGEAPASGISNQQAARRKWLGTQLQNTRRNNDDFETVRYAADGVSDERLEVVRPRIRAEGAWPAPGFSVTVTGNAASHTVVTPIGTHPAGTPMTATITAPTGQRFTSANPTITGVAGISTVTISANRRVATATFPMPQGGGTITVNATFETIPVDNRTVLAALTQRDAAARVQSINATSGVFASTSRLTAWDRNTQVEIGGTNRTPIAFENGALVSATTNWNAVSAVGIENATAFQFSFPTTGYSNITFSARQKSTASGPNAFSLAYRIGSTGQWVEIPNSTRNIHRVGDNTYEAYSHPDASSFINFALPAAVNNQPMVYLRVAFNGLTNLGRNGNTSINDIEIRGESGGTAPTLELNPTTVTLNDSNAGMTQVVEIEGTATGAVTLTSNKLPAWAQYVDFKLSETGDSIEITGTRPDTQLPPDVFGNFTIQVTRGGVTRGLTVDVNLTTTWTPGPRLHPITVTGGTATHTSAVAGERVTLIANPPTGQRLREWQLSSTDTTLALETATTFIMPDAPVTATAVYEPIPSNANTVTIMQGGDNASANPNPASPGERVTLNAGVRNGYRFTHWTFEGVVPAYVPTTSSAALVFTSDSALDVVVPFNVMINDETSATAAWFIMPSQPVTVVAHWEFSGNFTVQWPDNPNLNMQVEITVENANNAFDVTATIKNAPVNGLLEVEIPVIFNANNGTVTANAKVMVRTNAIGNGTNTVTLTLSEILAGTSATSISGFDRVTAPTITPVAGFVLGSVTQNGRVTSADATIIAKWLLIRHDDALRTQFEQQHNFCTYAADLDANNDIQSTDLTILARWLIGLNVIDLMSGN